MTEKYTKRYYGTILCSTVYILQIFTLHALEPDTLPPQPLSSVPVEELIIRQTSLNCLAAITRLRNVYWCCCKLWISLLVEMFGTIWQLCP